MKYMLLNLKSMWQRKWSIVLMVVQLIVSFWVVNHALITMETIRYQQKQLFSVTNMKAKTTVRLFIPDGDDSQWFAERFRKLEKFIKTIPNVKGYGSFEETTISPQNFANKTRYVRKNEQLYANTRMESYTDRTKMIYFDYDIYRLFSKFQLLKGRKLNKKDFEKTNKDVIPILIGYGYHNVFHIGDRFQALAGLGENAFFVTYEVVGILDQGEKWLSSNDYLIDYANELDCFFIAPYFPEERDGRPMDVAVRLNNLFLQISNKKDLSRVEKKIEQKGRALGIYPTLKTISDEIKEYENNTKQSARFTFMIGLFFIIVTLIGVISVTTSSIQARKYDIGVMMVTGASKRDIGRIVVMELFLLVMISAMIGVALSYWTERQNTFFEYNIRLQAFTWSLYVKIMVVSCFIVLLSSFIPLWNVNKLALRNLVEGRE
ncbi:macrolide ABC transporter permease [Anoxybacillus gonensis]|uniref:ABC transporter permease n=1 Tax=Anoxybacillus gonensis TaxID=198467 RepID=A0AAW7TIQ8_9BACL|nr:ABC transporter permease [Anoxybacillus gonensis]AKS39713.1 macrolide ABC transporter permease [Anoxybacillus gonensis]KGP61687.1 macrolide ABC transporter permease [Anoxybacillus gonensis]MDO0878122.1 ABC transporter permease [Anoxybacillus gonensis]